MAELPRIPSTEPVNVPASEEKQFPDLYISLLKIDKTMSGGTHKLVSRIHGQPFNYDTGEFGPVEDTKRIFIDDLKTVAEERAAAGNPALLQALGMVVGAAQELFTEGKDRYSPGDSVVVEPVVDEDTGGWEFWKI